MADVVEGFSVGLKLEGFLGGVLKLTTFLIDLKGGSTLGGFS